MKITSLCEPTGSAAPLEWEDVEQSGLPARCEMKRALVPGGWLLLFVSPEGEQFDFSFYPDPGHAWSGNCCDPFATDD